MKIVNKIKNIYRDILRIWILIRPFKKQFYFSLLLIIISSITIGSLFTIFLPLVSNMVSGLKEGSSTGIVKVVYDLYLSIDPDKRKLTFTVVGFFMLLLNTVVAFAVATVTAKFASQVISYARQLVIDKILSLKYSYICNHDEGSLVQLLMTEVRGIYAVVKQTFMALTVLGRFIVLFVVLSSISYKLTLFLVAIGCVLTFLNYVVVKKIKNKAHAGLKFRSQLLDFFKETVINFRQIKVHVLNDYTLERCIKLSDAAEANLCSVRIFTAILPLITQLVGAFAVLAIVVISFKIQAFPEVMSPVGGLINYLVVLGGLLPCLGQLNKAVGTIYANTPLVNRTFEFLYGSPVQLNIELMSGRDQGELFKDNITFDNVSFSYVKDDKHISVLKETGFRINKGDKVALIGKSGTGKSTIINLLLRLFEERDGGIYFDDENISDINVSFLRRKIGYVSQDIKLFNMSILSNLEMISPGVAFNDIVQACKEAAAHEFIMALPNQYDTIVGDRGENLSGGQRQRLAIAQVLLKKPELILLDEAVTGIDHNNATIIKKVIFGNVKKWTVLAVSHQMTDLSDVDKIMILDGGEIKEYGTRENLLNDENSIFYTLYQAQKL